MMKTTMLFGQKLMLYCIYLLVLVIADGNEDPCGNRLKIRTQLVDTRNTSFGYSHGYELQDETPVFEDGGEDKLDLIFYLESDSLQEQRGVRTICICMKTNAGLEYEDTPTKDCSGFSRICFKGTICFGKNEGQKKEYIYVPKSMHDKSYHEIHIVVEGSKAFIKKEGNNDVVLDIAPFSPYAPSDHQLPKLSIGIIAFYENVNTATDCTTENHANCRHADFFCLKTQVNPRKESNIIVTVPPTSEPEQSSTTNETSTSPTSPSPSTSTTEENATGSLTALYVCIGVVVAIVIL